LTCRSNAGLRRGFNLLPVLMTGLSFIASWLHIRWLNASCAGRGANMVLLAVAFFLLFYIPAAWCCTDQQSDSVIKSLWARR
jgi:hypothetical protein